MMKIKDKIGLCIAFICLMCYVVITCLYLT